MDGSFLVRPGYPVGFARPRPTPRLTIESSTGVVRRSGATVGTLLGMERVDLDDELQWTYLGTEGPDVVTYQGGRFAFRASTYGGDDTITGGDRADRLESGDGTDTVDGQGGQDTCAGAEVVTSC